MRDEIVGLEEELEEEKAEHRHYRSEAAEVKELWENEIKARHKMSEKVTI